jgi:hypothetical protein
VLFSFVFLSCVANLRVGHARQQLDRLSIYYGALASQSNSSNASSQQTEFIKKKYDLDYRA